MNIIDQNGIQIKEIQELVLELNEKMREIYGDDINLDPETPDGQWIAIISQLIRDVEELILNTNAMFDPDQAEGVILDLRVAINGIQRQAGSHSITNIEVTTNRAVTLYGLNHSGSEQRFIVEDNVGTQWILRETATIFGSGSHNLSFQSVNQGQIQSVPNTITTITTSVNGVVSVNNPNPLTTIGSGEETDSQLKERRRQSVSLSSQGYKEGLLAALRNIPGMIDAQVYENKTSVNPDSRGVPAHSIWVVTDGTAEDEDIAFAIYSKRNAGCGLKEGLKSYNITEVDGNIFTSYWDEVSVQRLFVSFTVEPIEPELGVALDTIINRLPELLVNKVGSKLTTNQVAHWIRQIDSNALVTNLGLSTTNDGPWLQIISPNANERFGLLKEDIIAIPILILPRINNISRLEVVKMTAVGGFGTYTWSIESGVGGIDPITGDFSSASIGSSTIKVVDERGNEQTKTIQVISG